MNAIHINWQPKLVVCCGYLINCDRQILSFLDPHFSTLTNLTSVWKGYQGSSKKKTMTWVTYTLSKACRLKQVEQGRKLHNSPRIVFISWSATLDLENPTSLAWLKACLHSFALVWGLPCCQTTSRSKKLRVVGTSMVKNHLLYRVPQMGIPIG